MSSDAVPQDEVSYEGEIAYEVARQILLDLIGYASERAATDHEWRARRDEYVTRLHALHEEDTAAIQQVLREDGSRVRELIGGSR